MQDTALALLLSRLDFAWITTMHILYPPLTVGLSFLLLVSEGRWIPTQASRHRRNIAGPARQAQA
jgi:cytochrome bd ubiquinol oxidase subunit I